jgi:hypothetical protein
MACQYFVNGSWISESQLKQVLNNGLLDNLVSEGKMKLPGFEVDSEKLVTKSEQVRKDVIPVRELQKLLIEEIKSRTGYPVNLINALELNEAGDDFKIPLWASGYVDKFESLLTSVVSNKIIKQKLNGNSFVLGSSEGFLKKNIKEQGAEETNKQIEKLGIITSANYDSKVGLQPIRYDKATKKMLPAQVMIPFKFRDNNGKLLNVEDFIDPETNLIDTNKIPSKLLQMFGFRIPTQGHNSMSHIEIVGFLPEVSGDLMLAPRDFVAQMGSDFDVDKLYTYQYNHTFKDGVFSTEFESNPDKIKKQIVAKQLEINEIKKELKLSESESKAFEKLVQGPSYGSEEDETTGEKPLSSDLFSNIEKEVKEELNNLIENVTILNKSYKASLQNKLLDIHLSVMDNASDEVVSQLIATDGFGELVTLANRLEALKDESEFPNILSETYQRKKYINATAGKSGTGNFSLDSTFVASIQGKDLVYLNHDPEGVVDVPTLRKNNGVLIRFGNKTSDGFMSATETLYSTKDNPKLKSKIIQSFQSAAVDNEKEQLLHKLNINDRTFDAIRAISMLGFNEKDIIGLINQPIIKEYLDLLNASQSAISDYNPKIVEESVAFLNNKYNPTKEIISEEVQDELANISGEELIELIESGQKAIENEISYTNHQQLLLLDKFISVSEIGGQMKRVQSAINSDSKGVPKNLIETSVKVKQISDLEKSNIFNATNLLGEYDDKGNFINPTTINGFASYYGTMFADKMFNKFFPYNSEAFNHLYEEILLHTQKTGDVSSSMQSKVKKKVFTNMKAYLFSSEQTGLYEDNVANERKRLFVDSDTNKSLATILKELKEKPWFQKNPFLNALIPALQKNSELSRVFYESTVNDNFDESPIYIGFLNMFNQMNDIGEFNGIQYSPFKLAQDLISYAYLEGGSQSAKQFVKYIPTAYLKLTDLGNYLHSGVLTKEGFGVTTTKLTQSEPSIFATQYLQNNPSEANSVNLEQIAQKVKSFAKVDSFKLNSNGYQTHTETTTSLDGIEKVTYTQFLSVYDKDVNGKYALYQFNNATKEYNRIPVVSDQYSLLQYDTTTTQVAPAQSKRYLKKDNSPKIPLVPEIEKVVEPIATPGVLLNPNPIVSLGGLVMSKNLSSTEQMQELLQQIATNDSVSKPNQELAAMLSKLELPANFKLVIDENLKQKGSYSTNTNTLTISTNPDSENITTSDFADVIVHEIIHAFTSDIINRWSKNPASVTIPQREIIEKLNKLKESYESFIKINGREKEYAEFKRKRALQLAAQKSGAKVESLDKKAISEFYGATNLKEFVTMCLTDRGFQEHLNSIKNQEGVSMWDKFVELFIGILNTLGLDIKPGSVLALAVENSIKLVNSSQNTNFKEFSVSYEQYQYYGRNYNIVVEKGLGVDILEYKGKNIDKQKLLDKFNENPNIDPQSGKSFKTSSNEAIKQTTTDSKYELFPGVFANQGQTKAIDKMTAFLQSDEKEFLLKGRGGTGKTTIVKKILGASGVNLSKVIGATVADEARGILAQNLPKAVKTATTASLLGLVPDYSSSTGELYFRERNSFEENKFRSMGKSDPIEGKKIIIIDEASMISKELYDMIIKKKDSDAKIIFMGDNAQIPPINSDGSSTDSPVFDLEKKEAQFEELTERMRQGAESPILPLTDLFANNIENIQDNKPSVLNPLEGNVNNNFNNNEGVLFTNDRNNLIDSFVKDYKEGTNNNHVIMIGARNATVNNFNSVVRKELFNTDEPFVEGDMIRVNSPFMEGNEILYPNGFKAKVIKVEQKGNHPDLKVPIYKLEVEFLFLDITGEEIPMTRTMTTINPADKAILKTAVNNLAVKAKNKQISWGQFYELKNSIVDLGYNYAITAHKVQGSTYKNVYVLEDDIMSFPGGKLQTNRMMYTALSRPTTKLTILTSKKINSETKPANPFVFTKEQLNDLDENFGEQQSIEGLLDNMLSPNLESTSNWSNFAKVIKDYNLNCE